MIGHMEYVTGPRVPSLFSPVADLVNQVALLHHFCRTRGGARVDLARSLAAGQVDEADLADPLGGDALLTAFGCLDLRENDLKYCVGSAAHVVH